jgi:uncharacterized protein (TIGR02266 family)
MSTNRRWPRMQLALDVQVRFDTADEALTAHTVNMSREGLFLAMDPPRPVGTRVRLLLRIAHEEFSVEGVVVRQVPDPEEPMTFHLTPGVGVFLTMTSPGYERWCDVHAPKK